MSESQITRQVNVEHAFENPLAFTKKQTFNQNITTIPQNKQGQHLQPKLNYTSNEESEMTQQVVTTQKNKPPNVPGKLFMTEKQLQPQLVIYGQPSSTKKIGPADYSPQSPPIYQYKDSEPKQAIIPSSNSQIDSEIQGITKNKFFPQQHQRDNGSILTTKDASKSQLQREQSKCDQKDDKEPEPKESQQQQQSYRNIKGLPQKLKSPQSLFTGNTNQSSNYKESPNSRNNMQRSTLLDKRKPSNLRGKNKSMQQRNKSFTVIAPQTAQNLPMTLENANVANLMTQRPSPRNKQLSPSGTYATLQPKADNQITGQSKEDQSPSKQYQSPYFKSDAINQLLQKIKEKEYGRQFPHDEEVQYIENEGSAIEFDSKSIKNEQSLSYLERQEAELRQGHEDSKHGSSSAYNQQQDDEDIVRQSSQQVSYKSKNYGLIKGKLAEANDIIKQMKKYSKQIKSLIRQSNELSQKPQEDLDKSKQQNSDQPVIILQKDDGVVSQGEVNINYQLLNNQSEVLSDQQANQKRKGIRTAQTTNRNHQERAKMKMYKEEETTVIENSYYVLTNLGKGSHLLQLESGFKPQNVHLSVDDTSINDADTYKEGQARSQGAVFLYRQANSKPPEVNFAFDHGERIKTGDQNKSPRQRYQKRAERVLLREHLSKQGLDPETTVCFTTKNKYLFKLIKETPQLNWNYSKVINVNLLHLQLQPLESQLAKSDPIQYLQVFSNHLRNSNQALQSVMDNLREHKGWPTPDKVHTNKNNKYLKFKQADDSVQEIYLKQIVYVRQLNPIKAYTLFYKFFETKQRFRILDPKQNDDVNPVYITKEKIQIMTQAEFIKKLNQNIKGHHYNFGPQFDQKVGEQIQLVLEGLQKQIGKDISAEEQEVSFQVLDFQFAIKTTGNQSPSLCSVEPFIQCDQWATTVHKSFNDSIKALMFKLDARVRNYNLMKPNPAYKKSVFAQLWQKFVDADATQVARYRNSQLGSVRNNLYSDGSEKQSSGMYIMSQYQSSSNLTVLPEEVNTVSQISSQNGDSYVDLKKKYAKAKEPIKVFISKEEQTRELQKKMTDASEKSLVKFQGMVRMKKQQNRFIKMKQAIIVIQQWFRCIKAARETKLRAIEQSSENVKLAYCILNYYKAFSKIMLRHAIQTLKEVDEEGGEHLMQERGGRNLPIKIHEKVQKSNYENTELAYLPNRIEISDGITMDQATELDSQYQRLREFTVMEHAQIDQNTDKKSEIFLQQSIENINGIDLRTQNSSYKRNQTANWQERSATDTPQNQTIEFNYVHLPVNEKGEIPDSYKINNNQHQQQQQFPPQSPTFTFASSGGTGTDQQQTSPKRKRKSKSPNKQTQISQAQQINDLAYSYPNNNNDSVIIFQGDQQYIVPKALIESARYEKCDDNINDGGDCIDDHRPIQQLANEVLMRQSTESCTNENKEAINTSSALDLKSSTNSGQQFRLFKVFGSAISSSEIQQEQEQHRQFYNNSGVMPIYMHPTPPIVQSTSPQIHSQTIYDDQNRLTYEQIESMNQQQLPPLKQVLSEQKSNLLDTINQNITLESQAANNSDYIDGNDPLPRIKTKSPKSKKIKNAQTTSKKRYADESQKAPAARGSPKTDRQNNKSKSSKKSASPKRDKNRESMDMGKLRFKAQRRTKPNLIISTPQGQGGHQRNESNYQHQSKKSLNNNNDPNNQSRSASKLKKSNYSPKIKPTKGYRISSQVKSKLKNNGLNTSKNSIKASSRTILVNQSSELIETKRQQDSSKMFESPQIKTKRNNHSYRPDESHINLIPKRKYLYKTLAQTNRAKNNTNQDIFLPSIVKNDETQFIESFIHKGNSNRNQESPRDRESQNRASQQKALRIANLMELQPHNYRNGAQTVINSGVYNVPKYNSYTKGRDFL